MITFCENIYISRSGCKMLSSLLAIKKKKISFIKNKNEQTPQRNRIINVWNKMSLTLQYYCCFLSCNSLYFTVLQHVREFLSRSPLSSYCYHATLWRMQINAKLFAFLSVEVTLL